MKSAALNRHGNPHIQPECRRTSLKKPCFADTVFFCLHYLHYFAKTLSAIATTLRIMTNAIISATMRVTFSLLNSFTSRNTHQFFHICADDGR